MLVLVWDASSRHTLIWAGLLVIQGLVPAATVFLIRVAVDDLVDLVGAGASWETFRPLLSIGALVGALMLLGEILGSAIAWFHTAQAELVKDHISALIHEKSTSVDLAFYESPDFHDHLERARSEADRRTLALLESGGSLLRNGTTLLALGALLVPFGAWLPFVLLASVVPAFYVLLKFERHFHIWRRQTTPHRRWTKYYDHVLTLSLDCARGPPLQSGRIVPIILSGAAWQASIRASQTAQTPKLRHGRRGRVGCPDLRRRHGLDGVARVAGSYHSWRPRPLLPGVLPRPDPDAVAAGHRRADLLERAVPGRPLRVPRAAAQGPRSAPTDRRAVVSEAGCALRWM